MESIYPLIEKVLCLLLAFFQGTNDARRLKAFDEIAIAYRPVAVHIARVWFEDEEDTVDDICQETFTRILAKPDSFKGRKNTGNALYRTFNAFVASVARNVTREALADREWHRGVAKKAELNFGQEAERGAIDLTNEERQVNDDHQASARVLGMRGRQVLGLHMVNAYLEDDLSPRERKNRRQALYEIRKRYLNAFRARTAR
jgi:RNA polymerase sigma factor (sigma-70 family)